MSFRIYRFDVLKEIARNGANVIYEARDTADSSAVRLYEWTPLPQEVTNATEKLRRLMHQLDGTEAFTSGHRLYLASPESRAKIVLQLLQSYNMFTGMWPGVFENFEVRPASNANVILNPHLTAPSVRGSNPAQWLWFAILIILAAAGAIVVWQLNLNPRPPEARNESTSERGLPSTPQEPVQIRLFNMEPELAQPGQAVTLSWEVINAREVWLKGLGPQPILVRHSGKQSYVLPRNARQIELQAIGEGAANSSSKLLVLHLDSSQVIGIDRTLKTSLRFKPEIAMNGSAQAGAKYDCLFSAAEDCSSTLSGANHRSR